MCKWLIFLTAFSRKKHYASTIFYDHRITVFHEYSCFAGDPWKIFHLKKKKVTKNMSKVIAFMINITISFFMIWTHSCFVNITQSDIHIKPENWTSMNYMKIWSVSRTLLKIFPFIYLFFIADQFKQVTSKWWMPCCWLQWPWPSFLWWPGLSVTWVTGTQN